jgi:hypothetical protein
MKNASVHFGKTVWISAIGIHNRFRIHLANVVSLAD